jgi:hypothetical protein
MKDGSLGCGCNKTFCVYCFLKDFSARKMAIWINKHGISRWGSTFELQMHLVEEYALQKNLDPEFDYPDFMAFLEANLYIGKKCPYCCKTCIWKSTEVPEVVDGKITFHAPKFVRADDLPAPEPVDE